LSIKEIYLKNFTVFKEERLKFAEGINIIVGENGTGKTHLLKSIYAACEISKEGNRNIENISDYFVGALKKDEFFTNVTNSLKLEVIPQDKEIIKDKKYLIGKSHALVTDNSNNQVRLNLEGGHDYLCTYEIGFPAKEQKGLFIPAKEMLSHSKGFLALNNKYDMPFDKTYVDIITNAELPEAKKIIPLCHELLQIISKIIDGEVIYENDTFYVVKTNGIKIEFSLEAEGLRKFGLLWKLIRNGLIDKDTILIWDEPEANINPELIPVIVDILLQLQRLGVQVFVATHSYNLSKYFEIKKSSEDKILYHNLYKTNDGVKAQSKEFFGDLKNNPIIEADSKLLDEVIEESLME
jgi:AAA15 family ATPase/GTPase